MNQTYDEEQQKIDEFIDYLWLSERLAKNTLESYRRDLNKIHKRLNKKERSFINATEDDLSEALFCSEEKATSRARALSACKRFYLYLISCEVCSENPSEHLRPPKKELRLPKTISEQKVEALLDAPNTDTPHGLRDKAILELMYATGMRVSEVINVQLDQINYELGLIHTIGKGDKERMIPVGEIAIDWIEVYLKEARSLLLKGKRCDFLFVSQKKVGITRQLAWQIVKRYASEVNINNLSPHTLRHAFATHLVNHGADLRSVQMLLGHANIATTQIYTHIAKERLRKLHEKYHPRG